MTVLAAYSSYENIIQIPAGVIQPPYFEVGNPIAVNYGKLGMVAGHEMMHAFDLVEAGFYNNNLDWWHGETLKNFRNRTSCFISDYKNAGLKIFNDTYAEYKVQGENICDSGGLKAAYRAFKNVEKREKIETRLSEDYRLSSDQLFFLSYAQNWCSYDEKIDNYVSTHPERKYRVTIVLNNNPDFLAAFNCPKPDKELCSIW